MPGEDNTLVPIKVLLVWPGDLSSEGNTMENVLKRLNQSTASKKGFALQPATLGIVPPDGSNPDDPLERQIQECHIFIGILWAQLTGERVSFIKNTVEWLRRGYEHFKKKGRPRIMFYFKDVGIGLSPMNASIEEAKQFLQIVEFRAEMQRIAVVGLFANSADLESRLHDHISKVLDEPQSFLPPKSVADVRLQPTLRQHIQRLQPRSDVGVDTLIVLTAIIEVKDLLPIELAAAKEVAADFHEQLEEQNPPIGSIEDFPLISQARLIAFEKGKSHAASEDIWQSFLEFKHQGDIGPRIKAIIQNHRRNPPPAASKGEDTHGSQQSVLPRPVDNQGDPLLGAIARLSPHAENVVDPPQRDHPGDPPTLRSKPKQARHMPREKLKGLTKTEQQILRYCDGSNTVNEILRLTKLTPKEVNSALLNLRGGRLVDWESGYSPGPHALKL